jgi:Spy/CpxP family protein refolding chaperone
VLLASLLLSALPALAQTPNPASKAPEKAALKSDLLNQKVRKQALAAIPAPLLEGAWWRNSRLVSVLGITEEQQKKMEDVFQQHRLQLIELNAAITRSEAILEPLLMDVRPEDEARILQEVDRAASARAELEKANARMLLGMRKVLTAEQWSRVPAKGKKQPANLF